MRLGAITYAKFYPSPGVLNYISSYRGERFAILGRRGSEWWSSPDCNGEVYAGFTTRAEAANAALQVYEEVRKARS